MPKQVMTLTKNVQQTAFWRPMISTTYCGVLTSSIKAGDRICCMGIEVVLLVITAFGVRTRSSKARCNQIAGLFLYHDVGSCIDVRKTSLALTIRLAEPDPAPRAGPNPKPAKHPYRDAQSQNSRPGGCVGPYLISKPGSGLGYPLTEPYQNFAVVKAENTNQTGNQNTSNRDLLGLI